MSYVTSTAGRSGAASTAYGLPKNTVTNGLGVRAVARARSVRSFASGAGRSIRPLDEAARTKTPATMASYRVADVRTRSISAGVDRSDSSIAVRFGQRWRSSGIIGRLGAAMRQPDG